MRLWCKKRTLYKALLTLVLALIVFKHLFRSFIGTRRRYNMFPNSNATRVQFFEILNSQNHPFVKDLFEINNNSPANNTSGTSLSTSKTYNFNSNLTTVEIVSSLNITSSNLSNMTHFENSDEIVDTNRSNAIEIPLCPDTPPNLRGRLQIVKSPIPTVSDLENRFTWLKPGGHWYPETCKAIKKVAIIVPYRYRGEHLLLFLQHMHPLLKKQQLDYTIFVVKQDGCGTFNKAMLMNVGATEALKRNNFDCFIFHDVDLLPEDDRILYTCPEQPRHMSVAVDKFRYKPLYPEIFGGVTAISAKHFKLLNGYSNSFWGWGGEDDDMSNRIRFHSLTVSRYPASIARYTMLPHKKNKPNPSRYKILWTGQKRFATDGLNNLKYTIKEVKQHLLYTWLLVELQRPNWWSRFKSFWKD
ncbi:hypothetical protein ILUMI_01515 [Ignelater luminosus]|uniref:Beta-1,4-N-acetylgalactosaminyltransferase n=1 Tax=Ignelater luminosus TaxID=2038154 RepID=A0A8K0DQK5_IGNLU|nr:hypothetical protein ILUMI_01515 [Ignelater luminosus]